MKPWPKRLWPWLAIYAVVCVAEFCVHWAKDKVEEQLRPKDDNDDK